MFYIYLILSLSFLFIFITVWAIMLLTALLDRVPIMSKNLKNIEMLNDMLEEAELLDDEFSHKKLDVMLIEEKILCEKISLVDSWVCLKYSIFWPKNIFIESVSVVKNLFKITKLLRKRNS